MVLLESVSLSYLSFLVLKKIKIKKKIKNAKGISISKDTGSHDSVAIG